MPFYAVAPAAVQDLYFAAVDEQNAATDERLKREAAVRGYAILHDLNWDLEDFSVLHSPRPHKRNDTFAFGWKRLPVFVDIGITEISGRFSGEGHPIDVIPKWKSRSSAAIFPFRHYAYCVANDIGIECGEKHKSPLDRNESLLTDLCAFFGGISGLSRRAVRAQQKADLESGDEYQQRGKNSQREGISRNFFVGRTLLQSYVRVFIATLIISSLYLGAVAVLYWAVRGK